METAAWLTSSGFDANMLLKGVRVVRSVPIDFYLPIWRSFALFPIKWLTGNFITTLIA
jgi:hypothetical protein